MNSPKNILKNRLCFSVQFIFVCLMRQVLLESIVSQNTVIVGFEFLLNYVLYSSHTNLHQLNWPHNFYCRPAGISCVDFITLFGKARRGQKWLIAFIVFISCKEHIKYHYKEKSITKSQDWWKHNLYLHFMFFDVRWYKCWIYKPYS